MRNAVTIFLAACLFCACDRGPTQVTNPQAFLAWTKLHGPFGGSVNDLAAISNGDVFASTSTSGLFVSHDDGLTWNRSTLITGSAGLVKQLASGDIYVTAGEPNTDNASSFYRSTDNGEHWSLLPTFPFPTSVNTIEQGESNVIFIATKGDGIYRSSDNGGTWSKCYEVQGPYAEVNFFFINDLLSLGHGIVLATTGEGVIRSTDNGNVWTTVLSVDYGAQRLIKSSKGNIFASAYDGIYRSYDLGATWYRVGTQLGSEFAMDSEGRVYMVGYSTLYYTDNEGDTWLQTSCPSGYSWKLTRTKSDVLLAVDPHSSIVRSTDFGHSWQQCSEEFSGTQLYDICAVGDAVLASLAGSFSTLRTTDGGLHWNKMQIANRYGSYCSFKKSGDGTVYVPLHLVQRTMGDTTLTVDEIHRSTDQGATWTLVNTSTLTYFTGFTVTNQGTMYVFGLNGAVHRSTDGGNTWQQFNAGLNFSGSSIAADDSGLVVIGGAVSTDGGESWLIANANMYGTTASAIIPDGIIFVGSSMGGIVLRSKDKGQTWETTTLSALQYDWVSSLQIVGSNTLVAGLGLGGVFISTDKGDSWFVANQGLVSTAVSSVSVGQGGWIYAATDAGLFQARLSTR